MKRMLIAAALALTAAVTSVAFASPAYAATQACVTSLLNTGSHEGVGTIRYSSVTPCNGNLTLVFSNDTSGMGYDLYAGRLGRSGGGWFTCPEGYIYAPDGGHNITLCSNLVKSTPFTVASYYDGGDYVQVMH